MNVMISPVDECTFSVHEVELVVQPGPGLHDGSGVGQTADSSLDLGKVSSRDNSGRLVVDPNS